MEFEKVTVDTYRIANGNLELPLVPQYLCNMLRDFTLSDLRDFLTIFDKGHSLTPAAFHRILESYGLAVKICSTRRSCWQNMSRSGTRPPSTPWWLDLNSQTISVRTAKPPG